MRVGILLPHTRSRVTVEDEGRSFLELEAAAVAVYGAGRLAPASSLAAAPPPPPPPAASSCKAATSSTAPPAVAGGSPRAATDTATTDDSAASTSGGDDADAALPSRVYVFHAAVGGRLMSSTSWSLVRLVPAVAGVVAAATLVTCLAVAKHARHVPFQMPLPFISLLGYQGVERYLYLGGCVSVAAMQAVTLAFFHTALSWFVERESQNVLRSATIWGVVAMVGLAGQAVVPIQADVMELMRKPGHTAVAMRTGQTTAHQLFGAMFFLGTAAHVLAMLQLVIVSPATQALVSWPCRLVKGLFACLSIVPTVVSAVYEVAHVPGPAADPWWALLLPTLCQWLSVMSNIALYSADTLLGFSLADRVFAEHARQPRTKPKQE